MIIAAIILAQLVLLWLLRRIAYRQGVEAGYGYRRDPNDSRYVGAGMYLTAKFAGRWPELRVRRPDGNSD